MKKKLISSLMLTLLLILTGCSSSKEVKKEENKKPLIYTSFFPVNDLVKQVAKDTVEVKTFMPTNTDPHLWEPTPKDMEELSKADLLFVNGANMERWVDKVRMNIPDLKIISLSDSITLITYKGAAAIGDFQYMSRINAKKGEVYKFDFGHTHENIMRVAFVKDDNKLKGEDLINYCKKIMEQKGKLITQKSEINVEDDKVYSLEMGHESGEIFFKVPEDGSYYFVSDRESEQLLPYDILDPSGEKIDSEVIVSGSTSGMDKITYDPHSWLSLKNAKSYINAIYKALVDQYGNEKTYYKNKVDAISKLTKLEYEYKEKFNNLKGSKEFVVTHYAWEYLSQEFGLVQYPLQGLISTESPSLKTVKKAINYCKKKDINTIFYEEHMPPKEAKTLADEIENGKVVPLTSMEYVEPGVEKKVGAYTEIMEDNLEKLYNAMAK